MNLTGLHLLLTYQCNFDCDHCFVWSGPHAAKTFLGAEAIAEIMRQARQLGTIEMIYFEGGEPFLHPETLLDGVKQAKRAGFQAGIVSNGFWARDPDTAMARLRPFAEAGLDILSISIDPLHGDDLSREHCAHAIAAAHELGISMLPLSVEPPVQDHVYPTGAGGAVMFRGRAAEKLADRVPHGAWHIFTACPHETLADPQRVHVDPYGYIHLCQGIVMGNLFEQPLAQLVQEYDPAQHPIVGPLIAGGPRGLVERYGVDCRRAYADACHLCYTARDKLRRRFPRLLAPPQMYGDISASGPSFATVRSKGGPHA